jgi:rhodanese-related sulfurtransferase
MKNVFLLLLFFSQLSCKSQQDSAKLNPDAFEKGIASTAVQILDVRTTGEYNTGHIKNSLQADWNNQSQFKDRLQYVDKENPVYVYCLAGGRSAAAANWMRENGFKKVIELQGGINAWKNANKNLEGNNPEPQMTPEQYQSSIPKDKTVLVDFGATWCPPCIKMNPVIEELQKEKSISFLLVKIDGGVHLDVMKAMQVEALPVFIIYKNGKEVWRKQGIVSKEELINRLR